MPKCRPINTPDGKQHGWMLFCPACKDAHVFDKRWTFNDDVESPTFTPSFLVYEHPTQPRCHSFVTDGKIRYLGDCTHEMANQTVDLPDVDDAPWGSSRKEVDEHER